MNKADKTNKAKEHWMDVDDAATTIEVSKSTVYDWISKSKVQTKVEPRSRRYLINLYTIPTKYFNHVFHRKSAR